MSTKRWGHWFQEGHPRALFPPFPPGYLQWNEGELYRRQAAGGGPALGIGSQGLAKEFADR